MSQFDKAAGMQGAAVCQDMLHLAYQQEGLDARQLSPGSL
jgi:hypothetical protein